MQDVTRVFPAEQLPRCQHCDNMPVEQLFVEFTINSVIFYALCHGSQEVVEVPSSIIWGSDSVPTDFSFGPAFVGLPH